jgi:outer membrane lipoprotein-sorting protein
MKIKFIAIVGLLLLVQLKSIAQTNPVIEKVRQKLALVNDYVAEGVMKTDVSFIKASLGKVKVYYKKPNLIKVKKMVEYPYCPKVECLLP